MAIWHQPSCENAASSSFFREDRFYHFCTFTIIADEKKKNLPKKQHECLVPLDPPPSQFVPLPHFTPTRMPDWDSASNSNNHLSLVQILEDETLTL